MARVRKILQKKIPFGNAAVAVFLKNLNFFFLLKFNIVYTFWIVLIY